MKSQIRVKQIKSSINVPHTQVTTLKGLGLRGIGTEVVVQNTPSFRGAIKKVIHLVQFEEI